MSDGEMKYSEVVDWVWHDDSHEAVIMAANERNTITDVYSVNDQKWESAGDLEMSVDDTDVAWYNSLEEALEQGTD